MKILFIVIFILAMGYLGFDYGRMFLKLRRMEAPGSHPPFQFIMVGTKESKVIQQLVNLDVSAHFMAGVSVKKNISKKGFNRIVFGNDDEIIVYEYGEAPITALTPQEKEEYVQKIFFDINLPIGAERAVVKDLGLVGYMISMGVCSEEIGYEENE